MNAKGRLRQFIIWGTVAGSMVCYSCNDHDKNSKDILTREQMVKALTEIYLAEQKINRLGVQHDSAQREFDRFKDLVLKKIDLSDSVFKKSFNYYMDRPKEMEIIFTALVDSLSLMEQRIEASQK